VTSISLLVTVGVVDRFPAFRRGMAAALREEGLSAEEVTDLCSWAAARSDATALVAIRSTDDLERIPAACAANPELTVVGIREERTLRATRDALRAGVATVVGAETSVAEMVEAIVAARAGITLLPTSIARDLASGRGQEPVHCHVSPREGEWIRELAHGVTVAQLAHRAGYSEREMYRCLNHVYAVWGSRTAPRRSYSQSDGGWSTDGTTMSSVVRVCLPLG